MRLKDPWWAVPFSYWLALELELLELVGARIGDREFRRMQQHYERTVAPHRRLRFK
jgi:hypothetical protein